MKTYGLTVRGVMKNDIGEILIVKRHPKSRTDPKMWELPGGKVEKGEHFADACEAIQNDYMHKRTVQLMMYLENIEGDIEISEEHTDWMWASLEKIKKLEISTSLEKLLKKRNWEI